MQRSAWRPTWSASARVRPLSSRTTYDLLRAVAGGHAGPGRGVRVHPLAGRGAGQQAQEDVEVLPRRHHLLDADDRDQHLGQGQAHPAVALGLDHDQRAGLGDREVGAGDGHPGVQELLAQVQPGGAGQHRRVVGEVVGRPPGHPAVEDLADLGAVAVDRRHQDVAGQVVAELDDELGQVGLPGGDALGLERLVEADLLGRHRLDLDDLVDVVARGTSATIAQASSASRAQCTVAPAAVSALLEQLELLVQTEQRGVLDRRARQPQLLPVVDLGDDPGPLVADGRGGVRRLRRSWVSPARRVRPTGNFGCRRRCALMRSPSVAARISARCITRTPARWRGSSAADVHQAASCRRRPPPRRRSRGRRGTCPRPSPPTCRRS